MAVSVRMEPLLEKELDAAARRRGISKSQFIIEAVERALGRKNPYELMLRLIAEEEARYPGMRKAFEGYEEPYDGDRAKAIIRDKLQKKHGVRGAR